MKKISLETYLGLAVVAGMLFFLFGVSSEISLKNVFAQAQDPKGQTISLTVQETITLTLSTTTVVLPALTPGTPVFAVSTSTVVTNSDTGWRLQYRRDSVTSTLAYGTTSTFPDFTAWDPTAGGGVGNATTTPGANLSFRVNAVGTTGALYSSTWWGANDADGTARFAGHPTSSRTIAQRTTYASGDQTVVIKLRADAPADQRSGAYTGTVTITAITGL